MGSLTRPGLQQGALGWDPEMEEAGNRPPYILMIDNYFEIYQRRRRVLISGKAPVGLDSDRPPQTRAWRAYQNRMNEDPTWERAERYRQIMQEQGARSIRALAKAIGEDHSRVARILKVLELPQSALEALRRNAHNARLRAHFTERRLRKLVRENQPETAILHEIEHVTRQRELLGGFASTDEPCNPGRRPGPGRRHRCRAAAHPLPGGSLPRPSRP